MRWRHVRDACVRRSAHSIGDDHPLVVGWHGHDLRAHTTKHLATDYIARIFDPRTVSWIQQQACSEVDSLLSAAHDNDLLRARFHSTGRLDVRGDFIAKSL